MKFFLAGGKQRSRGYDMQEWTGYSEAVLIELKLEKTDRFSLRKRMTYITPKSNRSPANNASITFKTGSLSDGVMLLPTQTEVLTVDPASFEIVSCLSLPAFNDVHHAYINSQGNTIVTSTGLDAVFEIDQDQTIINEWSCNSQDIWKSFDKSVDYRQVLTTKPHINHPNYSFELSQEIWVTRLRQKDILALGSRRTIEIGDVGIHDGIPHGGHFYFTQVNGMVIKVDMDAGVVVERIDLNQFYDEGKHIGWCRGIHFVSSAKALIGFTRIRPSKYETGKEWFKGRFLKSGWGGSMPTRVALFDLHKRQLLWEKEIESYGLNAVFTIGSLE